MSNTTKYLSPVNHVFLALFLGLLVVAIFTTTPASAQQNQPDEAPSDNLQERLQDQDELLPITQALPDEDPFIQALSTAYDTNPRILSQRKALEQANERVSQAIGRFRPSANATYQNGRQRVSFNGAPYATGDVENRTLNVSQPLFTGGQNIYGYMAEKDRVRAARNQLLNREQEVLLDAVVAYLNVVRDYSVLELSRNNENVLARQLEASRDRFSVGDVTRTDVAQSEARLSRAQSDTIQAQGDLESSVAQFERVIGYRPENFPLPQPASTPAIPATLKDAIDLALANNPQIMAAKFQMDAADDDAAVAVGRILPQITLQGSMNRQDGTGIAGANTFNTDQLIVNVNLPIYQNGSEYSAVRESNLLAKQREHDVLDARQAIREATIQAWENLQTASATIRAQENEIRAASIALDGVRQEQQYGARTVLDVLDAEQELFTARVALVRAQRDRFVSIYNLLLILGELTVDNLQLKTQPYDPEEHYDSVKWQLIGF